MTSAPAAIPARPRGAVVAFVLAAAILVAAGFGHRALQARIAQSINKVIEPRQALTTLPMQAGPWRGWDVPLDPRVLQAAKFDDLYVNRTYRHETTGVELAVFVGYVGRPRTWLGHRPDRCLVSQGWTQLNEQPVDVPAVTGSAVPSVLYEFQTEAGAGRRLLILGSYVINGRYEQSEDAFKSATARRAQLLGERPAYFARMQISRIERIRDEDIAALQDLAGHLAPVLEQLMPYWDGAQGQ